ncbi:hypothetical protein MHYP_G00072710 [Metynnis hypsauchen]
MVVMLLWQKQRRKKWSFTMPPSLFWESVMEPVGIPERTRQVPVPRPSTLLSTSTEEHER